MELKMVTLYSYLLMNINNLWAYIIRHHLIYFFVY